MFKGLTTAFILAFFLSLALTHTHTHTLTDPSSWLVQSAYHLQWMPLAGAAVVAGQSPQALEAQLAVEIETEVDVIVAVEVTVPPGKVTGTV